MTRPTVLTIDDVPSVRFGEKLDALSAQGIPAILFCCGEKIVGSEGLLIEAVRRGFVLGNHSWSHRPFSTLSLLEVREEILSTEVALEQIYRQAGAPRDRHYFRFPNLDVGTGPQFEAFQSLLRDSGFENWTTTQRFDVGCSFNQKEYDYPATPAQAILDRIGPGTPGPGDIILIHDHEATHELFLECLRRYGHLELPFGLP